MEEIRYKDGNVYEIRNVHKDTIKVGDTILCSDGLMRTVCKSNITNGFCGICIFGESYQLGLLPVKKVILKRAVTRIVNGTRETYFVEA